MFSDICQQLSNADSANELLHTDLYVYCMVALYGILYGGL